jgi:hypothetical protein
LLSINDDKPPGSDNLDGILLRIIVDDIATAIYHIFNLRLLESVALGPGGKQKSLRYPRIVKPPLLVQIAHQTANYQP